MTTITPNNGLNTALNSIVPDFSANATSGIHFQLSNFKGKNNIVLYFYPKDGTPGCTLEGRDFRNHISDFDNADTVVFGISRDSLASHEKFREKQSFKFELISDEDEALCQLFDVIKEKSMFGKKYIGIERSTFLINKDGILTNEWRKVRVKGHIAEVLAAAEKLP